MKPSPDQSSHAGSPGSPSGSGRPARILIAEDDAGIRETLTALVRGLGYDPVAAADGEAIPMTARILQVADVFDALISDRPYRRTAPKAVALEALAAEARAGWWDPEIIRAFREVVNALGDRPGRERTRGEE